MLVLDYFLHQLIVRALSDGRDLCVILRVCQPAVVKMNTQQVEDDTLARVLELSHPTNNHTIQITTPYSASDHTKTKQVTTQFLSQRHAILLAVVCWYIGVKFQLCMYIRTV